MTGRREAMPAEPAVDPFGAVDWAAEMQAILERHRHVTWLRPGVDHVRRHTASWMHIGRAREEGQAMIESRDTLPELVLLLQATLVCCQGVKPGG